MKVENVGASLEIDDVPYKCLDSRGILGIVNVIGEVSICISIPIILASSELVEVVKS